MVGNVEWKEKRFSEARNDVVEVRLLVRCGVIAINLLVGKTKEKVRATWVRSRT